MGGYVSFERPFKITGPDGTVYYTGQGKFGVLVDAETDSDDNNGIDVGGAVIVDSATVVASPHAPATEYKEKLVVARVAAAASVGFIGVAITPFSTAGSACGIIAGTGSIVGVRTTNGTCAVGSDVIGSATAGLCTGSTSTDPSIGTVLGKCVKAVALDGSLYFAGVLVCQS